MKRGPTFVAALGAALAVTSTGALASHAAARSCRVRGYVLVRREGVVVWTAHRPERYGNEGSVFVCAAPSGRRVLLQQGSAYYTTSAVTNASVTQLSFAGAFVGFFLRTNVEVYSKYLVVFDRLRGRVEFKDLAECDNNDECTGPSMTAYRLAADGWAAEVWPWVVSNAAGLLATNGTGHYQLDITRISNLRLSHGTLSWTSEPFGTASARLGPRLITASAPRTLSVCRLLPAGDLAPVLGLSPSSSSSAAKCTYTSTAYSGRTLTVRLTTGLSPAQMQAGERALSRNPNYCQLGQWWPTDDNFYDIGGSAPGFCPHTASDQFAAFANGAEVSLRVTAPPATGDEQLAHLSTVALDRLFGVPIKRAP